MAEFAADDRVDDLIAWHTLATHPANFGRFRRAIAAILRGDRQPSSTADSDVWLAEQVMGLLMSGERRHCDLPSAWNRRQIVRRAQDLIHDRLRNPPTILELCEANGASRRTLFYAFNDLLDLSPHEYIKTVRLQAARRMIVDNCDQRCVQRVARELGFVHEGQFAIDYASAFGEAPSKTQQRLMRSIGCVN
jgi:AraC family transcriptional regulator, ethanolamine operon transcriptional activator